MLDKNFDYLGKRFVVNKNFKPLCCGKIFKQGEILEIWKQRSPNRLYIVVREGDPVNSCHNVKRSTLNRCCELEDENYESKNKEVA